MANQRLALVTGANRGIGFEVARGLAAQGIRVVIGTRDRAKGRLAADALLKFGAQIDTVELDVADAASSAQGLSEVAERFGPVDILVNNAAVLLDTPGGFNSSVFEMLDETLRATLETNVVGPARLVRALVPGMKARGYGRVVNVSSMAGQLSEMGAGYPAYRMSKAALNALTRTTAAEVSGTNVKVNSVCPGWCRTDMGGSEAGRSAEQGADTITWLAMLPDNGPSGQFFKDRKSIAW